MSRTSARGTGSEAAEPAGPDCEFIPGQVAAEGTTRRGLGWLAPAVAAAAALLSGGYKLGQPSLWRDEAYTIDGAIRPVAQIVALVRHQEAFYAAYYLFMHPLVTLFGTSAVVLRLPSVLATSVAAALTTVLGRRLAALAGWQLPSVTGLIAGLAFVALPLTTRYAQEARSYAAVTALAVTATLLLVKALGAAGRSGGSAPGPARVSIAGPSGGSSARASTGWRWWAGYAAAIALTGLFSLFGLLIVVAHAANLVAVGARARQARHWAAAVAAALLADSPVVAYAYAQRAEGSWIQRPTTTTLAHLLDSFAGSQLLVLPVAVLAFCGIAAAFAEQASWRRLSVATVAAPWLMLPTGLLLAVSLAHPVYSLRYVVFCLPALALLLAAGLTGIARLVASVPPARSRTALAWLPSLAVTAGLAVMLAGPQLAVRLSSARPDNLHEASAIVAAHERPGDAVLYMPSAYRVVAYGYPAPFGRLRDVALARTPYASSTLTGYELSPAALRSRFAHVSRVWIISGVRRGQIRILGGAANLEKMALIQGWPRIGAWRDKDVLLSLYAHP